jgi:hypothetical protein
MFMMNSKREDIETIIEIKDILDKLWKVCETSPELKKKELMCVPELIDEAFNKIALMLIKNTGNC